MQARGREKEEYSTDYFPEDFEISMENADNVFPLISATWMLYMGVGEKEQDRYYATLMPLFNDSKV